MILLKLLVHPFWKNVTWLESNANKNNICIMYYLLYCPFPFSPLFFERKKKDDYIAIHKIKDYNK